MAKRSTISEVRFPLGGVNQRAGFGRQPRGTTPYAINIRPEDPGTLRLRGGSRPGLTRTSFTPPAPLATAAMSDYLTTTAGVPIVTLAGDNLVTGNLPYGATFACFYRDRLCLPGNPATNPIDPGIYCSRQGSYADFQYQADVQDAGRAIVFQLAEAGEIGSTPTALLPHKDEFLLAATTTSLWVVGGDPAMEGTLRNIHREVGIVGPTAWCKVVDDFIFLAKNDLYRVHCSGENLQNLTKGSLPEELRGLASASLGYDHDGRGVLIFTPSGPDWWYDLNTYGEERGGFWPIVLPAGYDPVTVSEVSGTLYLTCSDTYVRTLGGATDDSGSGGANTPITSHLLLGPMLLADPASWGRLLRIQGTLGVGSGTVNWNVVTGVTAEEAVSHALAAIAAWPTASAYVKAKGTLTAGRSHVAYPRLRAVWMVIWLESSVAWSYEQILTETYPDGRWR